MRLLVVEDNEQLAELLTKGLQTAGYETDVLSTLEEASTVLRTTFYAALILDLGLPDGDGLTLLRDLRHRNNPIPVLVLTARGGLNDRVQRDRGLRSPVAQAAFGARRQGPGSYHPWSGIPHRRGKIA